MTFADLFCSAAKAAPGRRTPKWFFSSLLGLKSVVGPPSRSALTTRAKQDCAALGIRIRIRHYLFKETAGE